MKSGITTKTWVLGFAVLFIWGAISYQLYVNFAEPDEEMAELLPTGLRSRGTQQADTIVLSLDYNDPFLDSRSRVTATAQVTRVGKMPTVTAAPVSIDKSRITYTGSYFNKKLNTLLGVIIVDGNETIAKPGDPVDGFIVKLIQSDSVCLTYNNQPFWIRRMK